MTTSLASPQTTPPPASARRLLMLAGAAVPVLLAHGLLLVGLPAGIDDRGRGPAPVVSVRQIVQRPPAAAARAAPEPATPLAPPLRSPRRPQALAATASADREKPNPPAASDPFLPREPLDEPPSAADEPANEVAASDPTPAAAAQVPPALPDSAVAEPAPAAGAAPDGLAGEPPPTYATRLPLPAVLRYELRRGLLTGQGSLSWQPGPAGYEMSLEGMVLGVPVLAWVSRGGVDAAGLAPRRFVDRRRGRDARAANFQRDKGVISWSLSPAEAPLLAGAQDRLSWMVQLAAIVDADPARFGPGTRVPMQVAGARGDVDVWTFGVVGVEPVEVAGARIEGTLALQRQPRKPYDTRVEVWLDPARQHLPVRLRLSTAGGGDSLEFVLKP